MLLGMEMVRELVETTILTGRVSDIEPVSLLLIATPECGKTSLLTEKPCKSVMGLTDVTGKGIQQICQLQPSITHFIINDLVAVMSHSRTVRRFTLAMLNAMTEEGIKAVAYPGTLQTFEHGKRGIIAALTVDLAADERSWWWKTGFATRCLPFCFDHSSSLTIRIKESISKKLKSKVKPQEFQVPEHSISVFVPKSEMNAIRQLADGKAEELKEKGYRRLKQYRGLAMAHALYRTWKQPKVCPSDLDFLNRINKYISFNDPISL